MVAIPFLVLFSFLPNNTLLPPSFQMAGFTFNSLAASPTPVVNDTAGERGYRFSNAGVEVALPATVDAVDLRACSFASPVSIDALDQGGAVVSHQQVANNHCADFRLLGRNIASLRLVGGNNEGMIVRIGIAIAQCGPSHG